MNIFKDYLNPLILCGITLLVSACSNEPIPKKTISENISIQSQKEAELPKNDTIIKSKKHHFKTLVCDLDGDKLMDSVLIVQNTINMKYGLKVRYGNKQIYYFGMGKEVLNQGFDDLNWIGYFEKVNKGDTIWSNVSEEGEFFTDDSQIKEEDKVVLQNDGIYIHQKEACGGGIIYREGKQYKWVQQE
jgi:hypothetical protein